MNHVFFNCQSKGGTGKSILTYLQALKREEDDMTCFIDVDSTAQTSSRLLSFLTEEGKVNRLFAENIFDETEEIKLENFFKTVRECNAKGLESIFFDCGAFESLQLLALIKNNSITGELKKLEAEVNANFIFNIVVCGGISYPPTFEYLKNMAGSLQGQFKIIVYVNMFTFYDCQKQLQQLHGYAGKVAGIKKVVEFGSIDTSRESGRDIMKLIRKGAGKKGYQNEWMARTKMERLLAEI